MLRNKYKTATLIFDYNVAQKNVDAVVNSLTKLGFKMEIFPNEDNRGRVIFFVTFDHD
jgi:hypothetical protein